MAKFNFSVKPPLRGRNKKPLDLGTGRLSASVMPDGRLCSINGAHPKHGFITLTRIEQIPEGKWYDSDFVRDYRRRVAEADGGFALLPDIPGAEPELHLLPQPLFVYSLENAEVHSAFLADTVQGEDVLIQRLTLLNRGETALPVRITLGGRLSLTRCSYGQLTERGPIPIPEPLNALSIAGNHLCLHNPNLGARFDLFLFDDQDPLELPATTRQQAEPVDYQHSLNISMAPGTERVITAIYAIGEDDRPRLDGAALEPPPLPSIPRGSELAPAEVDWGDFIVERNLDYILSCCAIPVGQESVCVITDHQLLPLAWNRDAYYMIELARASYAHGDADWKQRVQALVRGHLLWMFEGAQRPEGYWGRAYLTNGISKDQVFQLDQQCYPLLELCQYHEQFGDGDTVRRALPVVGEILTMLRDYKAKGHWLYETGETPADDDVEYPFHFSSQVLVWHTFRRLARLNREFRFTEEDLGEQAEQVRQDCLSAFTATRDGRQLFAYLTDLQGQYQFYHDANDLPTVLAPIWGFCEKTDPRWLETLRFAFTEENKGGYYPGRFGGLGSVHTPHKWPLGDAQELLFAWLTEDDALREQVLDKLRATAQWDGMFNEAVDEHTGAVLSRHWFSWPGAFIAYCLLRMRSGL